MVNRLLGLVLILLILGQAVAILRLLTLSPEITAQLTFPPVIQIVIGVTWIFAFGWGMIGLVGGKRFRAILTICGFIIYSLLQLVIFSQADYDRQREPFLLAVIGFVLILIIAAKYKETFTND